MRVRLEQVALAMGRERWESAREIMTTDDRLVLKRPLDMHLHLRDGDMLELVAVESARQFAGAVIMPNLVPPVTTLEMLRAYEARILAACGKWAAGFRPLMTMFF